MKLFENINREYTPGINLDVLDKTYNTLEVGHQKAIEASSALKTEIAKLPMNEAEDGFKQQLVNEIQNTIEANTIYGNSYGALDDLVLASGNIMSDPRVIGRLRSQKAYSDYQTQLDKSSLPQHYKNYYKKVNNYYHNDKIDETGKVVESTNWKPNEEYVDYIDVNTVMEKAIKSIAARKGSYSTPTVNPDGSVTTNSKSWNILTKDDIKKAIYNAFESTPGMTASLRQDYKIALDDLDSGNNPIIKDNAGNILTYDKYVDRIVDDFAETRDYNEVHSTSSYSPSKSGKLGSSKGNGDSDLLSSLASRNAELNSHIQGTTDILVNPVVDGEKCKKASSESFATIINNAFDRNRKGLHMKSNNISDFVAYVRRKNPDVDIKGPVTAVNTFFNSINPNTGKQYKDDYRKEEQRLLISLARSWGSQNYLDSQINRDYTEAELDARKFANSIANNGKYDRNNSSYDRSLVDATNLIFFGKDGIDNNDFNLNYTADHKVAIGNLKAKLYSGGPINDINITLPQEMFNQLSSYYNNDTDNIFSTKRLDNGDYIISINVKNKNDLPKLANNVMKANDVTTSWWSPKNWASLGAIGRKHYQFEAYGDENKGNDLRSVISYLSDIYQHGIDAAGKAVKKMNNAVTDRITVSSTSYRTKTAAYNNWLVKLGLLESTEANRLDARALDDVKSALKSNAVSLGLIMEAYENNVYKKSTNGLKVDEFLTKSDIPDESISWGEMRVSDDKDGIPDTKEGYYITIPVTEDNATDEYKAGSIVKLFISGSIDEKIPAGVINSSEKLADNIVFASTKTNNPMPLMDPNPIFANTQIKYNKNGIYDIEFAGNTYNGNESVTKGFAQAMYEIQQCKGIWDGTTDIANVIINKLRNPSINIDGTIYSILDVLSEITNTSNDTIDNLIANYIEYGNAE